MGHFLGHNIIVCILQWLDIYPLPIYYAHVYFDIFFSRGIRFILFLSNCLSFYSPTWQPAAEKNVPIGTFIFDCPEVHGENDRGNMRV